MVHRHPSPTLVLNLGDKESKVGPGFSSKMSWMTWIDSHLFGAPDKPWDCWQWMDGKKGPHLKPSHSEVLGSLRKASGQLWSNSQLLADEHVAMLGHAFLCGAGVLFLFWFLFKRAFVQGRLLWGSCRAWAIPKSGHGKCAYMRLCSDCCGLCLYPVLGTTECWPAAVYPLSPACVRHPSRSGTDPDTCHQCPTGMYTGKGPESAGQLLAKRLLGI